MHLLNVPLVLSLLCGSSLAAPVQQLFKGEGADPTTETAILEHVDVSHLTAKGRERLETVLGRAADEAMLAGNAGVNGIGPSVAAADLKAPGGKGYWRDKKNRVAVRLSDGAQLGQLNVKERTRQDSPSVSSSKIIASEPLSPHASAESLSRALVTVHSATPFFESIWKASHLADAQLQVQTRQSSGHRDVLSWVPLKGHLHHDGYWELPVSDVMINGESLGVTTRAALFDPASNRIAFPKSVADAVYARLPGSAVIPTTAPDSRAHSYSYPCSTAVQLSVTLPVASTTSRVHHLMPADFHITPLVSAEGEGKVCLGSVYALDLLDAYSKKIGIKIDEVLS